ncbi:MULTISPECIES: LuxR C-terminal-related transcriptional regulator [Streptomyces]|uniref:LuxR C-terminal-related transcriptional regulator n=1 Tax=Streptomyces TaxID=1883 RepID=UPI002557B6B8|nr:response regulator transcription factor [Streptomyces sp. NBRC 13847]
MLVIDSHPFFRIGLRISILGSADIELVGEADSFDEGWASLDGSVAPDVVIVDGDLPEMTESELIKGAYADGGCARVLLVGARADGARLISALAAGASGYVLKTAAVDEILHAIHLVAAGGVVVSKPLVDQVVADYERRPSTTGDGRGTVAHSMGHLTPRELDVIELIAAGASNRQIADRLFLSDKTVRNYVANVMGKLGVSHRSEAIVAALKAGFGRAGGAHPHPA